MAGRRVPRLPTTVPECERSVRIGSTEKISQSMVNTEISQLDRTHLERIAEVNGDVRQFSETRQEFDCLICTHSFYRRLI